MKGGCPEQFYELLFEGEEVFFTVNGKNYFSQGYTKDGLFVREVYRYEKDDAYLEFYKTGDSSCNLAKDFVNAPIFDGKTFWEVEDDIHWTTGEWVKYPDYKMGIYEESIIPYRRVGDFHLGASEKEVESLLRDKDVRYTKEEVTSNNHDSITILRTPKKEMSFFFVHDKYFKVEIREPFTGVLPTCVRIGMDMKEAQERDKYLISSSTKKGNWKSGEGYLIEEELSNNTVGVITIGIKDFDNID